MAGFFIFKYFTEGEAKMNPSQNDNEIILLKEVNNEDSSPFSIYDLDVALEQIRNLTVQPQIRCTIKGYKGNPGTIFFEWLNYNQSLSTGPKQLLIQICYDYLLARIQMCEETFKYLRLAPDADFNSLIKDFLNNTVDFAQWSSDAKSTKDKPLLEYRKRARD